MIRECGNLSDAGLYGNVTISLFCSLKDRESLKSRPVREQYIIVPDENILADKFPSGAKKGSEKEGFVWLASHFEDNSRRSAGRWTSTLSSQRTLCINECVAQANFC